MLVKSESGRKGKLQAKDDGGIEIEGGRGSRQESMM